jgi:transcriptional regulatory protein RtcR
MMNEVNVMGFLGTKLDRASSADRWEHWRPTISLCQQEDFVVNRLDLMVDRKHWHELAETVIADIALVSPETEIVVHDLTIRDPWDFGEVYGVMADLCDRFDFKDSVDYLAHMTTGTHVIQICWFLLTEARFFPGKLIQTSPPRGRRAKKDPGSGVIEVIDLDLSKYDQLKTRFEEEQTEAQDLLRSGIATKNAAFNAMIAELETVALRSRAPILLMGPTGAGKSQLARKVYELRQQRATLEGDFVEVNCATLRGDTAMSTLFGHKKGAFTGASADRPGLLRKAHQGMLFLDEIGELGLDEQAMLLRALEEGTFLPVGSDTAVKAKFHLIAGTNRDLRKEVTAGNFREDLLARIDLWTFELPGLADRHEDIEPNLDYELRKFSGMEGRAATFNKEARDNFLRFAQLPDSLWKGNFRDLNASVTRMATLAERGRIRVDDVSAEVTRLQQAWRGGEVSKACEIDLSEALGDKKLAETDPFDQVQLAYVIGVCRQSRTLSEAGREVFRESRKKRKIANDADRLKKYLAKFGLSFADL